MLSAVTEKKTCLALGALICISAYAFPWRLLTFGVLYSNLAAFCLVCSVCSLFLSLTKDEGLSIQNRLLLAVLFLFGLFDLFLLQPMGFFSWLFYCFRMRLQGYIAYASRRTCLRSNRLRLRSAYLLALLQPGSLHIICL